MRLIFQLVMLALVAAGSRPAVAASAPAIPAATNRVLVIDSSSMPIPAGKITLIIGTLLRTNGVYSGGYKIQVSPYFYKSENGLLAIVVPDEALKKLNQGKIATIVGTSTTSGKDGKSRHIDAIATPVNIDHGKLKLWFIAGDRKMTFEPAYHFAEKSAVAAAASTTKLSAAINLTSAQGGFPPSRITH